MADRDYHDLRDRAIQRLGDVEARACNTPDAESALRLVTQATFDLLGDRQAHHRPGALKTGERQFFVSGIFLVTPGTDSHLLVAEHGFPPEQYRLCIPIDTGHPGWVYQHQCPLILANTDAHADFKQILKTSRMGSALYGPMFWRGQMIGQLITAAQARHTFEQVDLDILVAFAHLASTLYAAHDGATLLY
ncbi:hypothetical protein C2W62_15015 [Candidatus Entotheonella serta]|nr:hypothetical protein C2W62_15015 [Candidatus Entotheonella serta]